MKNISRLYACLKIYLYLFLIKGSKRKKLLHKSIIFKTCYLPLTVKHSMLTVQPTLLEKSTMGPTILVLKVTWTIDFVTLTLSQLQHVININHICKYHQCLTTRSWFIDKKPSFVTYIHRYIHRYIHTYIHTFPFLESR